MIDVRLLNLVAGRSIFPTQTDSHRIVEKKKTNTGTAPQKDIRTESSPKTIPVNCARQHQSYMHKQAQKHPNKTENTLRTRFHQ